MSIMFYKNTLHKFLNPTNEKKVLYLDSNTHKIINNYFTQKELYDMNIVLVYDFAIPNPSNFIEIYLFSKFIDISNIISKINKSLNHKYIYSLSHEKIILTGVPDDSIIDISWCDMSFIPVLPNLICNVTDLNIYSILHNTYNHTSLPYDFITNVKTNDHLFTLYNTHLCKNFNKWEYMHLLNEYNLIDEDIINKSKKDPYYDIIWNKLYHEVIDFFNNETIKMKSVQNTALNFTEVSLKTKYIKMHLELLDKLTKLLNDQHIFEISEIQNKIILGNITQNDLRENASKHSELFKLPKISKSTKPLLISYTDMKSSLQNIIIGNIIKYKLNKDNMIYVLIDDITISEAIQCASIFNLIFLCRNNVSFNYNATINNNTKHLFNITNIYHKNIQIKLNDSKYNKYSDQLIILKSKFQKSGIFEDDDLLKQKLNDILSSIKKENEILDIDINSKDTIKSHVAKCDKLVLEKIYRQYVAFTNYISTYEQKYELDDLDSKYDNVTEEENENVKLLFDVDLSDEIEKRNISINKITQDIEHINKLYCDMHILLQDQGLMIDNIQYNICQTVQHMTNATTELLQTEKYQKKINSITKVILGTTVGVGAILGVVLGVKLKK